MTTTWGSELNDQLEFYWTFHLRPRLEGLTDDEYLHEPADWCWSLRRRTDGRLELDGFQPEPPTPPVTTIAWRTVHIGRDVLGQRARALFGPTPAPADANMYDGRHWPEPLPERAADAIAFLEQAYTMWHDGVAGLDDDALRRPIGPKGGPYAEHSMYALAAHINREVMAHGAEICLLRDLYRSDALAADPVVRAAMAGDAQELTAALRVSTVGSGVRADLVRQAAGRRHWDAVRVLVAHGFDVNGGSPSALHYAAAAGAGDAVRFLIEHGGDVTRVDEQFGFPPAGWADYYGQGELASYLRSVGSQG